MKPLSMRRNRGASDFAREWPANWRWICQRLTMWGTAPPRQRTAPSRRMKPLATRVVAGNTSLVPGGVSIVAAMKFAISTPKHVVKPSESWMRSMRGAWVFFCSADGADALDIFWTCKTMLLPSSKTCPDAMRTGSTGAPNTLTSVSTALAMSCTEAQRVPRGAHRKTTTVV